MKQRHTGTLNAGKFSLMNSHKIYFWFFIVLMFRFLESRTQAPSLLSESQLISLMDKNGIGTDATIAQHITTIQDRVSN